MRLRWRCVNAAEERYGGVGGRAGPAVRSRCSERRWRRQREVWRRKLSNGESIIIIIIITDYIDLMPEHITRNQLTVACAVTDRVMSTPVATARDPLCNYCCTININ
jgi:hypothetical protein